VTGGDRVGGLERRVLPRDADDRQARPSPGEVVEAGADRCGRLGVRGARERSRAARAASTAATAAASASSSTARTPMSSSSGDGAPSGASPCRGELEVERRAIATSTR
jgi:hypothetical protein